MQYINVDSQASLTFSETALPEVLSDECLLKVKAIGVNRADLLQRAGKYPAPKGESSILGLEVSGEIVQCGELVTENHLGELWQKGDKVFALVAGGGYDKSDVHGMVNIYYENIWHSLGILNTQCIGWNITNYFQRVLDNPLILSNSFSDFTKCQKSSSIKSGRARVL